MTRAFVLMTAMPPTKGHLALIDYAVAVADYVTVIVNTQPEEPLWAERVQAIREYSVGTPNLTIEHIHQTLPQEPEDDPGFWDMWAGFLWSRGFQAGDYVVASEKYGVKLSQAVAGTFMPYDMDRRISRTKATWVRLSPLSYFEDIAPSFQSVLRKRVTIFGAESVGKTTLAFELAEQYKVTTLPEWARPYLETVGSDITLWKMNKIWRGQRALQEVGDRQALDTPFIVQDTDLFSTVGYWDLMGERDGLGKVPPLLVEDALTHKSDLYLILNSNIPFEEDPLRYGGHQRESDDTYWIDLCRRYGLNYRYIEPRNLPNRLEESWAHMEDLFGDPLHYVRSGAEYQEGE